MPKVVPGYKDAARSRIAEAAQKVFSIKGYRDATMDDIARELGVSKGAIYLYFKGKDDLLKEIAKATQESLRQCLHDAFQKADTAEVVEEAYKLIFQKRKVYLRIMFETTGLAASDDVLRETLKESHERHINTIREFLQDQIQKGRMSGDRDPDIMARQVSALYMGLARMLILGYGSEEVKKVWQASFMTVLGDSLADGQGVAKRARPASR